MKNRHDLIEQGLKELRATALGAFTYFQQISKFFLETVREKKSKKILSKRRSFKLFIKFIEEFIMKYEGNEIREKSVRKCIIQFLEHKFQV